MGGIEYAKNTIRNIGLNIKALRAIHEMTQEDLAEKSGVSREFINRLERATGNVNPTIRHLAQICAVLDIEIELLFVRPKHRIAYFVKRLDI